MCVHYLFVFILYVCVSVCSTAVCHVHLKSPQRPEEDIRPRVTIMQGLGTKLRAPARAKHILIP